MKSLTRVLGLMVLLGIFAARAAFASQIRIFDEHRSHSPATFQFDVEVSAIPAGQQARLALDARIDWPSLGGSNPWMIVKVNGTIIKAKDLLNKPDKFRMSNGLEITWFGGRKNAWRAIYAPDFKKGYDTNEPYAALGADPYHYVWNITPYLHPGKNVIEITHLKILKDGTDLVLRNGEIEIGDPIAPPASEQVKPAPTGPLKTYSAQLNPTVPIVVNGAPGELGIDSGDQRIIVKTRTSLPDGKWWEADDKSTFKPHPDAKVLSWKTPQYSVQRNIQINNHRITVNDTFTNRTSKMIGVMVEHQLRTSQTPSKIFLAGMDVTAQSSHTENSANPSAFVQLNDGGAALLAEGDIFRAQALLYREGDTAGLADYHLGIGPNASVTLQWAIYPLPRGPYKNGDYWDFVNAVRRDWKTNFTIPGPFDFINAQPQMNAAEVKDYLSSRQVKLICGGIAKYKNGKYAHGTGILFAPEFVKAEKDWAAKVHEAVPGVKVLCYFHEQISSEPDSTVKYADDRDHDIDGKIMSYPYKYDLPIFIPTVDNKYGKALWGYVKTITDTIGADGLYWDEMSYSVNKYASGAPWDGCSALINYKTHAFIKPLSNVSLLTQPLKLQILDYLRAHGKYFMGNSQAATQTMMQQNMVRFVETGSYSRLQGAQLECPLGLGNNHAEDSQADVAQSVRDMLQYGCYYYGWTYRRDVPAWDFEPLLYPMTPQRLGEGFLIGKERIVTATSGIFAFDDGARGTVYEVDENGARVKQPGVKELKTGNRYSYEVRIPSNHFVIIVRQNEPRA